MNKTTKENNKNTQKQLIVTVCRVLLFCVFCVARSVCFYTGHFVTVPLNITLSTLFETFFFELLLSIPDMFTGVHIFFFQHQMLLQ